MKIKGCSWLKLLSLLTAGIFFCLFQPAFTQAASTSLGNFTATIEVPENQIGNNTSYFDILQAAGTSSQLTIDVTNDSTEELNLNLSFNRAVTNIVGVVEYSGNNTDLSQPTLNIEDFVELETSQLTLAAGETAQVPLTVTMPETSFDGIIAGGIYISAAETSGEDSNVKQRFSREIALLLQENQTAVTPELAFEGAEAAQENGRNGIDLLINNQAAAYLNQVNLSYTITRENETILEDSSQNLQFAPSSRFNFFIPMENQSLTAGDYQAIVTATSGQQEWQETVDFTISPETAADLNATSAEPATIATATDNSLLYIVIAIIVVLAIGGGGFFAYKYWKLKKQLKK
ncbi:DUF916 and DUF3324 domain-containing protein [Enterococcus sp. LJL120]